MGRWVRVNDALAERIRRVWAEENLSEAKIQRRFGISEWTFKKIVGKPRKQGRDK